MPELHGKPTLFGLVAIIGVICAYLLLSGFGGTDSRQISAPKPPLDLKDYDAALLRKAAEQYTDPDNIADIPDEVIIEDFINIAFSHHEWLSDFGGNISAFGKVPEEPEHPSVLHTLHKKIWRGAPWAADYIERPDGVPAPNRLVKWAGPVRVFVGDHRWGNPKSLYYDDEERHRVGAWMIPVVRDHVRRLSATLKELTQLDVLLTDNPDEADLHIEMRYPWPLANVFKRRELIYGTRPSDCRNCIVTHNGVDAANWGKVFRRSEWDGGSIYPHDTYKFAYEYALKGAIRFTPDMKTQVEGFLLPRASHELGKAVCQVWFYHTEELTRALTTECLARALGLPDVSAVMQGTALGHWNKAHDPHTKELTAFQGEGISRKAANSEKRPDRIFGVNDKKNLEGLFPEGYLETLNLKSQKHECRKPPTFDLEGEECSWVFKYAELIDWRTDKADLRYGLSSYDRLMVNILYQPELAPGMSVEDARSVLPGVIASLRAEGGWKAEDEDTTAQEDIEVPAESKALYSAENVGDIPAKEIEADFRKIAIGQPHDWKADYWREFWDVPSVHFGEEAFVKWPYSVLRYDDWRNKYFWRPFGVPKAEYVVRWERPIRVSVYGPAFSLSEMRGSDRSYLGTPVVGIIRDQAQKVAAEISALTGRDVQLANERLDPSYDGNLHILPVFLESSNLFKEAKLATGGGWPSSSRFDDSDIKGAIRFTPYLKAQVEGYIVPAYDFSIDRAVCKIWWNHSEEMVRALVTECLVRAMGLPHASGLVKGAVLSNWNSAHAPYSRMPVKGASLTDYTPQHVEIDSVEQWQKAVAKRSDMQALPKDLSQYDRVMLKLLYHRFMGRGVSRRFTLKRYIKDILKEK